MYYIFMDNFRGFKRALVPIGGATFLVGENSTGKSSFLSLAYLLSQPQFWFNQDFSAGISGGLGGFNDIVSFASDVRTRFTIGTLAMRRKPGAKQMQLECALSLMTFRDEEGMPRLCRYIQYIDGKLIKIAFLAKAIWFKIVDIQSRAKSDDEWRACFLRTFDEDRRDRRGFKKLPPEVSPGSPLAFVLAVIQSADKTGRSEAIVVRQDMPIPMGMTWLAPIRTKPRRTYDGFKTDFTPEGDHTPYVIRKTLGSRDKAQRFTELLCRFGKTSGLFSYVRPHSFGRDPAAPFEVRIEISGGALNISNVGYGVSQVLPVIVEMLTRPDGHWFAIQQPEVHLHPRAQAALGDLLHFMVKDREHNYIIETHSEYLIDRFRFRVKECGKSIGCRVIFFERQGSGNVVHTIPIDVTGRYSNDQPDGFKRFFIDEQLKLLEI